MVEASAESRPRWRAIFARGRKRSAFALAYLALSAAFLVGLAGFYSPGLGFTRTIQFGEKFESRVIPELQTIPRFVVSGDGYDGQFYAELAAKPAPWSPEIKRALDKPAYRSARILPSLVAYALALGEPAAAMHVYAIQNVAVWLALAVLFLFWFPPGTVWDFTCWTGLMFSAGIMMSVCRALPDIWALLLVALGLWLWEGGKPGLGAGLLGVSGLARETSILAASALFEVPTNRQKLLRSLKHVAIVALPALVLMAFLKSLEPSSAGSGNFDLPFVAMFERFALIAKQGVVSSAGVLVTMVAMLVQAGFFVLRPRPSDARWRLGIVQAVLMAVLGEAVWRGYPGAAPRVLLPMLLAFNLSVPRLPRFWPLLIVGNLSIVTGIQKLMHPPPAAKADTSGAR